VPTIAAPAAAAHRDEVGIETLHQVAHVFVPFLKLKNA
jgi:hypothetical protein